MTNDEREVLIDVLVMTRMSDFAGTDVSIISDAATDILKKFTLRRPVQGEPTDARWIDEIEWEYGCRSGSHSGLMRSVLAWGDEQTWTDHLAECPAPAPVRRRKAGEWLSAEQEDNHA